MTVTVVGRELAVRQPANLPAPATVPATPPTSRPSLTGRAYAAAAGTAAVTVVGVLGPHPALAALPGTITAALLITGTFALVKGGV
jgi:hypothetical protein